MEFNIKPGAPRKTHPIEAYIKKYGKEAGVYIFNFKQKHKWNRLPWSVAYGNIRGRCQGGDPKSKYYKESEVRNFVTPNELRYLFFRDKAYLMEMPSIDRINPDGHYEASNMRWIEFEENRIQKGIDHPKRLPEYKKLREEIEKMVLSFNWRKHTTEQAFKRIIKELYRGRSVASDDPIVI